MSVECAIEGKIQHKQLHRTTDLTGSSTTCRDHSLRRRKEREMLPENVSQIIHPGVSFPRASTLGKVEMILVQPKINRESKLRIVTVAWKYQKAGETAREECLQSLVPCNTIRA